MYLSRLAVETSYTRARIRFTFFFLCKMFTPSGRHSRRRRRCRRRRHRSIGILLGTLF